MTKKQQQSPYLEDFWAVFCSHYCGAHLYHRRSYSSTGSALPSTTSSSTCRWTQAQQCAATCLAKKELVASLILISFTTKRMVNNLNWRWSCRRDKWTPRFLLSFSSLFECSFGLLVTAVTYPVGHRQLGYLMLMIDKVNIKALHFFLHPPQFYPFPYTETLYIRNCFCHFSVQINTHSFLYMGKCTLYLISFELLNSAIIRC